MTTATNEKPGLHRKILALWHAAIDAGDFEKAIRLDFYHYENLVKATEDLGYWDRWQDDTHAARLALVERMLSAAPSRLSASASGDHKFAIVNHNYSGLAHEVQLSRNIQYLRRQGKVLDFDVIYLFGNLPNARQHAAALYQIPESNVIFLAADSYEKAADRLDLACRRTNYRTVVYPSVFAMAFWMSLFNTHPRQKFLQMKYYPLQAGRIAQWAGGRRTTEERFPIRGCDFLQLETLDLGVDLQPELPTPMASYQASNQAAEQPITFGSISRPEKVADPTYNSFVAMLLRERPSLTYLYAGRPEAVQVIPEAVRNLRNAIAIGWVHPASAIRQFAIYLEPFPWGGGEMSLLALRAGIPYLSLGTEENIRFGMFDFLRLIAVSGPDILQFSFCRTIDELRSRLFQLIDDEALRRQLGDAWRKQVESWRPGDVERWIDFLTN